MAKLSDTQLKICKKRYFQPGEETWDQIVDRVVAAIMQAEKDPLYKPGFEDILLERRFMFNTPTWINAGLPGNRTLSACFVGGLEDSMLGHHGILDCGTWFGTVQKYGGGTGVDLSRLRPKGSPIKSTHGKACGPIRVLKYLAATSQMITQGGARDGANMAVMSVYHKDIEEFITCKSRESKFLLELPVQIAQQKVRTGEWTDDEANAYIEYCKAAGVFQLFNLSVAVDNNFMNAVLAFAYGHDVPSYNELLPCGKSIIDIWRLMVNQAWESGDPGILFIERAQTYARFHSTFPVYATNPCGEQWLPPDGSCNLGSLDLAKYVSWTVSKPDFNWSKFQQDIHTAVRLLDNIVTINQHPVADIKRVNEAERRIGLGVMGYADMLMKMRLTYDSDEALEFGEIVAKVFKQTAHEASVELAKERGPFPLWEELQKQLKDDPPSIIEREDPIMPSKPRRNATVTTVAPTGTISIVAGCSSGIEPHFDLGYEHKGLAEHGGLGYIWASDTLEELFSKGPFKMDDAGYAFDETLYNWGHNDISNFDRYVRHVLGWKPANEIDVAWHIKHQALWQKYVDNSISKTINLPNNAQPAHVAETFRSAFEQGCKGCTVYRDGCKPFQVLQVKKEEKSSPEPDKRPTQGDSDHLVEGTEGQDRESYSDDQDRDNYDVDPEWDEKDIGALKDIIGIINSKEDVVPGVPLKQKRPDIAHGVTIRVKTGDGSLYVVINRGIRDEPFELFAVVGKAGGKAHAYTEAIGRLISLALQYNIPMEDIIKNLRGISAGDPIGFGNGKVLSVPDGIGQAMQKFLMYENEDSDGETSLDSRAASEMVRAVDACPECGVDLHDAGGCKKCIVCGYERC